MRKDNVTDASTFTSHFRRISIVFVGNAFICYCQHKGRNLRESEKPNRFWHYKVRFILSNISEIVDFKDRLGGL